MDKQKSLLVLGAGNDQVFAIKKAKDINLRVICVDINKNSPGFKYADFYKVISTRDTKKIEQYCQELKKKYFIKIDGILVMGTDIPHIQAKLAKSLNVHGPSLETAKLTTDKYLMKKKLKTSNINIPWFKLVENYIELKKIIEQSNFRKFIIKPIDRSGARGVFLYDKINDKNLDFIFEKSKNESFCGKVQIEEYINGPQISTESLIINGKAYTPGFVDRNYEMLEKFYPHVIENGGTHPSKVGKNLKLKILDLVEKSALSLGIKNGVAKGDIVISNNSGSPYLIEMASRLSGGDFSESLIPLGCGVDIVTNAIKLSIGEKINKDQLKDKHTKYVANRYFFGRKGSVKNIIGVDKIRNFKWLKKFELYIKNGDYLKETDSHASRIGVFIVTADNLIVLEERIQKIYETVKIIIN